MASRKIENSALLLIQLYKSPEEGYDDLNKSLKELESKITILNVETVRWKSDAGVAYFEWPGFMDLAALITSTGVGVGIYNSVKLWLESRNGRRFRIKIGDVEVESTQINEEKFLNMLHKALELRKNSAIGTTMSPEKVKNECKVKGSFSGSTFRCDLTINEFLMLYESEQNSTSDKPNADDRCG